MAEHTGPRLLYKIVVGGSVLSLVLQIIGLVTPGWLVLDFTSMSKEFKFSMGLWYVNYCYKGACDTSASGEFWDRHYYGPRKLRIVNHDVVEYQIETIIAIVSTIVLIVSISKILCCSPDGIHSNTPNIWRVILASSALSGILALTASVKYGGDIREAHESFEISDSPSPYKKPWSLIITGVGGLISGLIFVVMVIETCRAVGQIRRDNGEDINTGPVEPLDWRWWYNRPRLVYNYVWNKWEFK